MTRRLKALGITLVALLATSAAAASAAQAEAEFFYSHSERTVLTGESLGLQKFDLSGGEEGLTVECAGVTLGGTQSGEEQGATFTTESVRLHPDYYGIEGAPCRFEGISGTALPIMTDGCHYEITATTEPSGSSPVHLDCGEGALEITFAVGASNCITSFATQTSSEGGASFENDKSGSTSEWDTTVAFAAGFEYTSNEASACAVAGIPNEGLAIFTGEATIQGFEDEEETETGEYAAGPQTGIWRGPAE